MVFRTGSTLIFNRTFALREATNVSQLFGMTGGSPLFRLVLDLEMNSALTVSITAFLESVDDYVLQFRMALTP